MYSIDEQDYLAHHGIKGMKWGVRRFQNEDGSLTNVGKSRYKKSNSEKSDKTRKYIKWGVNTAFTLLTAYGMYKWFKGMDEMPLSDSTVTFADEADPTKPTIDVDRERTKRAMEVLQKYKDANVL